MKGLLLALVVALQTNGQGLVITAMRSTSGSGSGANSGGGQAVTPTDIAGLAYYWNYTDVATNSGIYSSPWVDRVQSKNIAGSDGYVTNTASGVFIGTGNNYANVNGGTGLTLNTTNWSAWVSFQLVANSGGYTPFFGNEVYGLWMDGGTPDKARYYDSSSVESQLYQFSSFPTAWIDLVLSSGSSGVCYTNGVQAGTFTVKPTFLFKQMGGNSHALNAYVKFVAIWTNSLTATDAENLSSYGRSH